jgi:hypothetical protein
MGSVKATLDLPEHLVRQVKQRALQQGRPFKDLVAEYIRQGLHGTAGASPRSTLGVLELDADGLPVFRRDPTITRSSPDLVTALQLEQEALLQEDRRRAGLCA